jgi:hypothetical protein
MGFGIKWWDEDDVTYNNIDDIDTEVSVRWNNKPFLDCVVDLMKLGDVDCFVDNDNDFHLFKKNSKNNDNEAVVWNDSLIELRELGKDSIDVRNKIIVYGEAGGLPVIHTSTDSSSISTYGTKEKVITNSAITDESIAADLGDAEKVLGKSPTDKGSADCFFMPNLIPGHLIYVIFPPSKIHDRYRPIRYTFKIPEERTEVVFSQERGIPKLFKERIEKSLSQEVITNPHKMTHSYNFTFDDEDKIDIDASSNYEIGESLIWKTSGTETAIIISNEKEASDAITAVHVLANGETLDGATYWVQADSSADYQQVTLDTLESITDTGTELRIKIIISSDDTRIDSLVVMYK